MPTVAQKKAAIEKEYQELLEKADAEGDTEDESEVLIIRAKGKGREKLIQALTDLGYDISDAEEVADEIEEEILDEDGNPVVKEDDKKPPKKTAPKKAAPKKEKTDPELDEDGNPRKDPEPPSPHRFFGGRK